MTASQLLVPGILGFAPATDAVYLREMQAAATAGHGGQEGTVNVLRTLGATLDTDEFFRLDAEGRTAEAERLALTAARALRAGGADAVILGCTDLMLFGLDALGREVLPIIDSTRAHARAAAALALGGD